MMKQYQYVVRAMRAGRPIRIKAATGCMSATLAAWDIAAELTAKGERADKYEYWCQKRRDRFERIAVS